MLKHFCCFIILLLAICPLRAQRSEAVVTDYLQKEWQVDFSDNNRIVIFENGQEKFDDMFRAIKQARHSVHLEYFNFRNDSISSLLFDLLAEKAAEGVEVRALFDGFGNSSNDRPLESRHLKALRARGIEIYEFDRMRFPWITNALHRDHRKIVVIDGLLAYTGGMNVADYYIEGKPEFGEWRDIHARVEGDVVADLQGIFVNFWNYVTKQNLCGEEYYPGTREAHRFFTGLKPDVCTSAGHKKIGVTDRDHKTTPRIIHDTFIKMIDSAENQIQLINPYFTLCDHLLEALKRAAKRGVDVQIMVSEKCDIPITPRIVEYHTAKLMACGAKIYVFQGGFHHSKIMMMDGQCAYIGSANMNGRSMSFDYECNLFIADAETTHELQQLFERDKQNNCFLLTPEIRKAMPLGKKLKGWLMHFLIPLV